MSIERIPATVVRGFLGSGKSVYIQDCLRNDFFHKRGRTLLILFEEGEFEYDADLLETKRTVAVTCPPDADIAEYVKEMISLHQPDRIYMEMNAMRPGLEEALPGCMDIKFIVTIIDGSQLGLFYNNLRQQLRDMILGAHQVIFNRCPVKEQLEPYGNIFRVMNNSASYLWEAPAGYHEKAFGVMVPYDLSQPELSIGEAEYTAFYLDSLEAPGHYEAKTVTLDVWTGAADEEGGFYVGRQVMTCCAADISFLSIACSEVPEELKSLPAFSRIILKARTAVLPDRYGQKKLRLIPVEWRSALSQNID